MKPRPPLPDGPFLVVGLARSGVAAALALRARGAEVIACDSESSEAAGRLRDAGVEVRLGTSGLELVPRARTLIKSPGVSGEAPVVTAARAAGATVIGELELAWRLIGNDWIAVTGTNGKTTTTELIGAIHREAALPVAVTGNIGTAASSLALAEPLAPGATVVCETSSFQLEDTIEFSPDAAVLLNLAPDHLDRHGSFDAYRAAKLRAFARQGNDDVAVAPTDLGIEDLGGCARRVLFGAGEEAELSERAGWLWWDEQPLLDVGELRLRGRHNVGNAMAAAAVTLARGVDPDAVRVGLRNFHGVAHRLETVAVRDGVVYVNDSKATNVASAIAALRAFEPGSVHAIMGGRAKGESFAPLVEPLRDHARAVYLIGEAADQLAAELEPSGVTLERCGELEGAFSAASAAAQPGETILLAPACASYDQYRDFVERGEHFRRLALGR